MFRNAPLTIDISALEEDFGTIELQDLISQINGLGIRPIGIRGGSTELQNAARSTGLAVLAEPRVTTKSARSNEVSTPEHAEPSKKSAVANESTVSPTSTLITKPVRSGQRIYAANGDLIILTTVGAGAEIIADGNIHIYGTLRGRALAGVKGNLETRIFCSDLQAELVSIAGQYQISEGIDDAVRGKPVQIYLSGDSLLIETLF